MKKKNSGYFYAAAREIIGADYEKCSKTLKDEWTSVLENPGKWLKTRAEIVAAVCEKKNLDDDIQDEKSRYTLKGVRPSVHRSLTALLEAEEILLIWDKYYVPNVLRARQLSVVPELREVPYAKEDIFFASPKLVMIPILELKDGVIGTIKQLFRMFIGKKNCYDVRVTKNYVVLMIEGKDEEVAEIGKRLVDTVRYCYQSQKPKGRGLRKKKPILRYARVEETAEEQPKEEEKNTGENNGDGVRIP